MLIRYCDNCSRRLPQDEVPGGQAETGETRVLCAACTNALGAGGQAGPGDGKPRSGIHRKARGDSGARLRKPSGHGKRPGQGRRKPPRKALAALALGVGAAGVAIALALSGQEDPGHGARPYPKAAPATVRRPQPPQPPKTRTQVPEAGAGGEGGTGGEDARPPRVVPSPGARAGEPAVDRADAGLLVWYRLDEKTGRRVTDSSGNGNNGTVWEEAKGWRWTSGRLGGAFDCASCAYIEIDGGGRTALASVTAEMTVAFWARGGAGQPRDDYLFKSLSMNGDSYYWRNASIEPPAAGGRVVWGTLAYRHTEELAAAPDASVSDGAWHHWAFVKNSRTGYMRIYLDGAELAARAGTTRRFYLDWDRARVGGDSRNRDLHDIVCYDGMVDDFRIYNRELGPADVTALRRSATPGGGPDDAP